MESRSPQLQYWPSRDPTLLTTVAAALPIKNVLQIILMFTLQRSVEPMRRKLVEVLVDVDATSISANYVFDTSTTIIDTLKSPAIFKNVSCLKSGDTINEKLIKL